MAKTGSYGHDNGEAARIILSDPERYGGLALEWAKLWVSRHKSARKSLPAAVAPPAHKEEVEKTEVPEISVREVQKQLRGGEEP